VLNELATLRVRLMYLHYGVGALWGCIPRVCGGGGGCAGGGVPLGAVPALSWCEEVSLGGIHIIIYGYRYR